MAGSKGEADKSRFSSATRVQKIGSDQDFLLDSSLPYAWFKINSQHCRPNISKNFHHGEFGY